MQEETNATVLTVSQIVRSDYRTADVFKRWGINYCCGGNLPLAEACSIKNLNTERLQAELTQATRTVRVPNAIQFANWPVSFLVDYIIHIHHGYLHHTLPALQQSVHSFVRGHLKKYPYLAEVSDAFDSLAAEVLEHTRFEEESIFPYVRQVSNAYERREIYGPLFVRTLRKPLDETVKTEHTRIYAQLEALRSLTQQYRFPAEACTNHQVIYHKFREIDEDLVQHKHLEDDILFPKVLEMEKTLLQL